MEPTASDWENFWSANVFAVITDNTKPAMKWAASELKNRGRKVYIVDLSDKPAPESLKNVSELPGGLDRAIIGITKSEPGDLIPTLKEKGAKKVWIHWKTETEKALGACRDEELEYLAGRCPMMYLGSGLSIHGLHRTIAKMTGNY
ncbi:MAG TPA: CoA-binding protein [Methanosarcina sp.]|nr:CoA-binding protein [Methanosarcina sp.]